MEKWYEPAMYDIPGPDDQFYGYLFSARNYAFMQAIHDKTLRVYDLDPTPLERI
jgi:hypothetical protein